MSLLLTNPDVPKVPLVQEFKNYPISPGRDADIVVQNIFRDIYNYAWG